MFAEERYCAVIIDIVKSTQMDELQRFDTQKKIENTIEMYNLKYESTLAAKIDFSGGDQLQALFLNAHDAYAFSCEFREKMFPIQFRMGLGIGNWSLRFPGDSTNKQDGTSYHNARTAYDYAYKLNKNTAFYSDCDTDAFINVLISQEYAVFNSQSTKQKKLFSIYKDIYPINPTIEREYNISTICVEKGTQKAIADKLASSRQNVNKLVRAGSIYEQRDLQGTILLLLTALFDTKGGNI